ncbi:MAG: YwqI/YxiC family protein [Bacillus sp. (in: firmicutes)]
MEMKIVYKDIEQTLDHLVISAKSLDPIVTQDVYGANHLETIEKLNQLNRSIQQLFESYKDLLLTNEMSTRQSVQFIQESDSRLASEIEVLKFV